MAVVAVSGLLAAVAAGGSGTRQPRSVATTNRATPPVPPSVAVVTSQSELAPLRPTSLDELLLLAPDELARVDLALMNLLCAEGLPGSEGMSIPSVLKTLDQWAERVRLQTLAYEPRFRRNPAENFNSEADFRMLTLVTVLERDLGVRYNPKRVRDPDFGSSKDLFIHGLVNSDNGGTCASMPVLNAVIARRLGYPVRLVQAKEHLFSRWDDPKGERLNIDSAGMGMNTMDDAFYREWPKPVSDEEVANGDYLKSLSVEEDLAVFLAARGHCLFDHGRFEQALDAYREAAKRMPTPDYLMFAERTEEAVAGRLVPVRGDGSLIARSGAK